MNIKPPKCKMCRTVGALIKELEKLPKTARLDEAVRPDYANTGPTAKEMGLKPCVLLNGEW